MDAITKLCKQHGLFLVEDCAQAHFAEWNGKKVGTIGDAGTFSFFPGKNLGAYGDAGAIVTQDDKLADKMRMFANHGALIKHSHEIEGINSRMDGLQAAILSVKLKYIVSWSEARYLNALKYHEYLKDINEIIVPKIRQNVKHVFHLYVVRTKNRSFVQEKLKEAGISSGIHYPTPLPFLNAYKYLNHKPSDFPVSYEYKDKILSLPMYPELSEKNIIKIQKVLNSCI